MSNNPNRNKVLLGFGAVVAVLIVAFLMWPANVTKEDASGAIGAVQKHHAPQITQQDVVLGNEAVKRQQEVLYKDFLADAGKLRAIGTRNDANARAQFTNELQMRAARAAREAVAAARSVNDAKLSAQVEELNSMIGSKEKLSNDEIQAASHTLGLLVVIANRDNTKARMDRAEQELRDINLADQSLAVRQVSDIAQEMNRADADLELADFAQYFDFMSMESRVLERARADEIQQTAAKLDQRAQSNIAAAALRDQEMAVRCSKMLEDINLAENRSAAKAQILGSTELSSKLNALANQLRDQEQASRKFAADLNALDARKL